ncbi:hypothetical protein [Streptomyces ardesiacus]|uniref:hypothetical protein n=1 Tax=Streptomyces ardesiacus TaxID=285564 RepID=UPI003657FB3C
MAEISYPFADNSAGGGGKLVSVAQWQKMSHQWAPDAIDRQIVLGDTSGGLPFYCSIEGSNLLVRPGSAWVGGFYYTLDAPKTIPLPTNPSNLGSRIDVLVIRANMATGAVNLAISEGQPSVQAREAEPQRVLGGIWEMPIWAINLPRNGGAATIADRRRYSRPEAVDVAWNRDLISKTLPVGTFTIDQDINSSGGQQEGFRGIDGDMVTRGLGARRKWTPDILSATNKPPAAQREGYWRRIAPGTASFSLQIRNTSSSPVTSTSAIVLTLPTQVANTIPTILQGQIDNPENRNGLPNFVDIVAKTSSTGNNYLYLYYPSPTTLSEGLDVLKTIPGKSTLIVSGVYETNDFEGPVLL